MTAYTTITTSSGLFDPAAAYGRQCINDIFCGDNGKRNLALLQQYGTAVSGTLIEYVRRLSLNNQHIHSLLTRSLAIFNSNVNTASQEGKFTVTINLGEGILPEDVKVTAKDRELLVEVKAGRTSADGTARLVQEYSKKITLPEEVKAHQVKSILSPEGVLKIEAPLPEIVPGRKQVIEIPVNTVTDAE